MIDITEETINPGMQLSVRVDVIMTVRSQKG